ncbi:hypothetical protein PO909_030142 [Leuciscus waleckii]
MYQSLLSSFSVDVHAAKSSYFHNKINSAFNTRSLFKTFNSLLCLHHHHPPPLTSGDLANFFTDKTTISSQFSAPHTQEPRPTTPTAINPLSSFSPLTEEEVSKLLLSSHPTTASLSVTEALRIAKAPSKSSVLILLDLPAAFDTVNHQILLSTLLSLGITGTSLHWFESYLTDDPKVAARISSCLEDISTWMKEHHLQLNLSYPARFTINHYQATQMLVPSNAVAMEPPPKFRMLAPEADQFPTPVPRYSELIFP